MLHASRLFRLAASWKIPSTCTRTSLSALPTCPPCGLLAATDGKGTAHTLAVKDSSPCAIAPKFVPSKIQEWTGFQVHHS